MKRYKVALLLGLPVIPVTSLKAEWAIGRGAVSIQTSGALNYDSNLQASAVTEGDFYLDNNLTALYRRQHSRIKTDATLVAGIERYLELTDFNSENYQANYALSLPRGEDYDFGASATLAYFEQTESDVDLNTRVHAQSFNASLATELALTRNHIFSNGLAANQTLRDVGSASRSYEGNLKYDFLGFAQDTSVGIAYTGKNTQTDSDSANRTGLEQVSHSLSVQASRPLYAQVLATTALGYSWLERSAEEQALGLTNSGGLIYSFALSGEFLPRKYFPKTKGTFRIGYEEASSPGLNDNNTRRVVGNFDVRWQARERTSVGLSLSRNQDLTATDNTVLTNTAEVNITQAIGQSLNSQLALGYTLADYPGLDRVDHRTSFTSTSSYVFNRRWSTAFRYGYLLSLSSATRSDYASHNVRLSATYVF
jgi:Putative beta-barrel porin 2